jgi:hypothetical protein
MEPLVLKDKMRIHFKFRNYFLKEAPMRLFFLMVLILALGLAVWAPSVYATETASFLSVKGTVLVKDSSGQSSPATVGSSVAQGESVVTDKDAEAVLKLFDGSQLTLKPGTDLELSQLEKPSDTDKILKFKLLVGEMFAKVEKLVSAKSSFEVEAGGVVCGVRGTEIYMNYDSVHDHLDLRVLSGRVYVKAGGQTTFLNAGEAGHFTHGMVGPGPVQKEGDEPLSHDPALRDLKAQFARSLLLSHDDVFTDPAVGGLSVIPLKANVPSNEAGP